MPKEHAEPGQEIVYLGEVCGTAGRWEECRAGELFEDIAAVERLDCEQPRRNVPNALGCHDRHK